MQGSIDVITVGYGTRGWGPVSQLTKLAAEMLSSQLISIPAKESVSRLFWARMCVPRRSSRNNGKSALLIVGVPGQLFALLENPIWLGRYEHVAVWVIDSFWNERIPKAIRKSHRIDWIWVTDVNDIPDWEVHFGNRVGLLPWGTDALKISREYAGVAKSLDLLRVGRQPREYDDDLLTLEEASKVGISFAGRPSFGSNDEDSQENLHASLSVTKSILAFSNKFDDSSYTHPTKEYVTGRWMDAIAHGAAVAGVMPSTPTAEVLVPEFARIRIDPYDRALGLGAVKEWLGAWNLEKSNAIRRFALESLDWRYRLVDICTHFGVESAKLDQDILALRARVETERK